MKKLAITIAAAAMACGAVAQNPYMPLWEFIPDGEPYVFEDPDKPGQYRVYVYGSHDNLIKYYCGLDQVAWSAPVDDLTDWRFDGVIFRSDKDANGNAFAQADVLYAPDVTEVVRDGKKEYYLCPNVQNDQRHSLVAKSDRPDGPFEVVNWNPDGVTTFGPYAFDPAIFCDDDGRIYGYWGFERSYAAELDPNTMSSVKPGTEIVEDMVSGRYQDGVFRFFEASSMRKVEDKYVFIYSRFTEDGEFGLPTSNYTLAYAYSDSPLGPWTYGGTIIDGRARDTDENGKVIPTACPYGNTHGSICQINGKWYVFYHRQTGTDEYARQAMVAPIDVKVQDGKVIISEAEYTSEGFLTNGLNPFDRHAAGIACYYTGPTPARQQYPNMFFTGSYIGVVRPSADGLDMSYSLNHVFSPVVNNTDGSVVGYKYFNFDHFGGRDKAQLLVNMLPSGIDGEITVMVDSPWESKGGKAVGTLILGEEDGGKAAVKTIDISGIGDLHGKHPIFFRFVSPVRGKSICDLYDLQFK